MSRRNGALVKGAVAAYQGEPDRTDSGVSVSCGVAQCGADKSSAVASGSLNVRRYCVLNGKRESEWTSLMIGSLELKITDARVRSQRVSGDVETNERGSFERR